MSISQAMSTALAGLGVATRATTTVSSNVANALSTSYARREMEIGSIAAGGARTVSVTRAVDIALQADRRLAQASAAGEETMTAFLRGLEEAIGSSDDAQSLTGRVAALEAAITTAAASPQSTGLLDQVAGAAGDLAGRINAISAAVQGARGDADAAIAADVATLNESLARVKDLNDLILARGAAGKDVNDLLDQRQAVIDGIAEIIPVKEIAREGGRVALYTETGALLVDSEPVTFGFDRAQAVTAGTLVGVGATGLSGLTINGRAVDTLGATGAIAGGRLAANFAIRDVEGVEAQAGMDALARNLIDRFADPATDATLTGQAGLFTDGGSLLSTGTDTGLAGRLAINRLADPEAGGDATRLRDGLGATTPKATGDASALNALVTALNRSTTAPGAGTAGDFASFSSVFLSDIASARLRSETQSTYLASRATMLSESELANGVSQDDEMQKLLLIEKAYAANAKVIQTVDSLLETLLEM